MPGVIPHLLAGSILFVIGRFYFSDIFKTKDATSEQLLLAGVCLFFSLFPDFSIAIYYTTHVLPYRILMSYQMLNHVVLIPLAIGVLIILLYKVDIKRKPVWIMSIWALTVHITMDFFINQMMRIPHGIFI